MTQKRAAWTTPRRSPGEKNKLEAKFEADFLAPRIASGFSLWYRFEPGKFRLTDRDRLTSYTPDYFEQIASGELVAYEIKGSLFPEKNRLKCKLFADQYPIRLTLARYRNRTEGWTFEEF